MLQVKDLASFRKYYKEEVALRSDADVNTDFIDVFHPESPLNKTKGFANLVYGTRSRKSGISGIAKFLRSISLKVASDVQSLYELLQNADDEGSDFVMLHFSDNYLICINNGKPFTKEDFSAIINVADTDKNEEDIGSFGIGFKILHRLVGKDDGEREIINEYAGPIIFSWNNARELELLQSEFPISTENGTLDDVGKPWLAKLIYTCFPTHPNETVYDKNYTPTILFKEEELQSLRGFLRESVKLVPEFNSNRLDHGSLFFLKFGEGKSESILNNIADFSNSIENSLLFLKNVKKVYLQGTLIHISGARINRFLIEKTSDQFLKIDPEVKERDIEFVLGFYENYKQSEKFLQHPSLYNYFSLSEEVLNQRYILHCNAFDMHNDRRKLQPTSARNQRLLPIIAKTVKEWIVGHKETNPSLFENLYAAVLLSEQPILKNHIDTYYFQLFSDFLPLSIPTKTGFASDSSKVRIKKTDLDIRFVDIGHKDLQWLLWEGEEFKDIHDGLIAKLKIVAWDIKDIVDNSVLESLNSYFRQSSLEFVKAFLIEMCKEGVPRQSVLAKLSSDLEYIPFSLTESAVQFTSLNKIKNDSNKLLSIGIVSQHRLLFEKLGFTISILDFEHEDYRHLKEGIVKGYLSDKLLFERIKTKIETDTDFKISEDLRIQLFNILSADPSGSIFSGVATATGDLLFFRNKKGEVVKVKELLDPALAVPPWLQSYQPSLDGIDAKPFFIGETELYNKIIVAKWDEIRKEVNEENCSLFYSDVKRYFLKANEKNRLQLTNSFYLKTNLGWAKGSASYYFLKNLNNNSYAHFLKVWSNISVQHIPSAAILDFLFEEPFLTVERPIIPDMFIKATHKLANDELNVLFQFVAQQLAANFIIIENNFSFWLTTSTAEIKYKQLRSDSSLTTLSQEIRLKLSFCLVPLPEDFANYKSLYQSDDEIIAQVIDELSEDDALFQIFQCRLSVENYVRVLKKLSKIRIDVDEDIKRGSNLFNLFYYYSLLFETKGFDQNLLKSKLTLIDGEKEWPIRGLLSASNHFKFSENVSFNLSDLIPSSYSLAGLLDRVKFKLTNLGLNEEPIHKALGIKEGEEGLSKVEVFDLLQGELNDRVLNNSEQLRFVCNYIKAFQLANCDLLVKVVGAEQQVSIMNQLVFSSNGIFTDEDRLLDKKVYVNDFGSIVINEKAGYGIYSGPRISAVGFVLAGVKKELASEEERTSLLDFYFQKWRNLESVRVDLKIIPVDSILPLLQLLKLDVFKFVYPDKFALDEEKLPPWLSKWIQSDESYADPKEVFLSLLKLYTTATPQVMFRKGLTNQLPILSSTVNSLDYDFLVKSLDYVKLKNIRFDQSIEQLDLIISRIGILAKENKFPTIHLHFEPDVNELLQCDQLEEKRYETWKNVTQTDRRIFVYKGKAIQEYVKSNFTGDHVLFSRFERQLVVLDRKVFVVQDLLGDLKSLFLRLTQEGFLDNLLLESFLELGNGDEKPPENEEIRLLKEIYAEMQADLIEMSPKLKYIIEAIIKGDIATNRQKAINYSARIIAFKFLKNKGYQTASVQISDEFDRPSLENVFDENDFEKQVPKTFLVRSAIGGLLYLNDFSWFDVGTPNTQLLIHVDEGIDGIILIKDQAELIDRLSGSDRALVFRIEKGTSFSNEHISNILLQLKKNDNEGHLILRTKSYKALNNLFGTIDESPLREDHNYSTDDKDWDQ